MPDREIADNPPGALLATVILPLAAPAVVGVKTDVTVVLLPALIVIGKLTPVRLNGAPDAENCEIVSVALPLFVKVIFWLPLLPTVTFP